MERMERIVRIILIGDAGVGKTSLFSSYADNTFTPNHVTTMGVDFRHVRIRVGKEVIKLQLWDTAGHERYRSITNTYYRGADLILLVYDVTNRESFLNLEDWLRTIEQTSDARIVIVGNKVDLERQVSRKDAARFAKNAECDYMETSAKTAHNIIEVFEQHIGISDCAESIMLTKETGVETKSFWGLC